MAVAAGRLARFGLITADPARLTAFYEQALGFRCLGSHPLHGAESVTLGLGEQIVELLRLEHPGRPYPDDASSSDLIFQHFAIVVADIAQAYLRLASIEGWTAISTTGPQLLPATSGGVTAFKFRDPEGHPLELLAFPSGNVPSYWQNRRGAPCLGIDHSAIAVSDSARSIAFYEQLGFHVAGQTLNSGPEQAQLDGLADARVEVTALAPRQAAPHLELLCYKPVNRVERPTLRQNDIAATRLILESDGIEPALSLVDPDGHHLLIVPPYGNTISPARDGIISAM